MVSEARKRALEKYNKSDKNKANQKRYYESHKEILYQKQLAWEKENKDKRKIYNARNVAKGLANGKSKNWYDNYPKERKQAVDAANNALKRGKLKRKYNCEACDVGGLLHKHHPDYSKPLEVIWLCPTCHKKEHRDAKSTHNSSNS